LAPTRRIAEATFMTIVNDTLAGARPDSIREVTFPRRIQAFPSPADWRDELYFLLPDRFSDGQEGAGRAGR
jgi:hypothetical protein